MLEKILVPVAPTYEFTSIYLGKHKSGDFLNYYSFMFFFSDIL